MDIDPSQSEGALGNADSPVAAPQTVEIASILDVTVRGVETPFSINSRFENTAVIVLDCLSAEELQTGRLVYDTLRLLQASVDSSRDIERIVIADPGDLRTALDRILIRCRAHGMRPILHFECHGHPGSGLAIGPNQLPFGWSALESLLRPINVACEGHLGVVMAMCHGLYAIAPLRIHRHAPFYFLIGAQDEITAGELADRLPLFYQVLFETNDLDRALEQLPACRPFHAEHLIVTAVARYFREACMGRGASDRAEHLVTGARWHLGGTLTDAQLKAVRQSAKQKIRTDISAELFEKYVETFLGRRPRSYDFEEIHAWIRS